MTVRAFAQHLVFTPSSLHVLRAQGVWLRGVPYSAALWIIGASLMRSIVAWRDAKIGVAINAAVLAVLIALQK